MKYKRKTRPDMPAPMGTASMDYSALVGEGYKFEEREEWDYKLKAKRIIVDVTKDGKKSKMPGPASLWPRSTIPLLSKTSTLNFPKKEAAEAVRWLDIC